jgi:hypothetical protein
VPERSETENKEVNRMKNVLWMIGGFCAAATGFLVWNCRRTPPVELLAHRLEAAWADHHTIV